MPKEMREVEVSKEMLELMQGLAGMVLAVRKARKDGWDLGQDLPELIGAAVQHLVPAVDGIELIDDEWKEDKKASLASLSLGLGEVLDAASQELPSV